MSASPRVCMQWDLWNETLRWAEYPFVLILHLATFTDLSRANHASDLSAFKKGLLSVSNRTMKYEDDFVPTVHCVVHSLKLGRNQQYNKKSSYQSASCCIHDLGPLGTCLIWQHFCLYTALPRPRTQSMGKRWPGGLSCNIARKFYDAVWNEVPRHMMSVFDCPVRIKSIFA